MMMFLRCVGEALVAQGMRGLLGLAPFGEQIYDVAANVIERYRQARREQQVASDLQQVVQADMEQIRAQAHQIARDVGAGRSEDEVRHIEAYLRQIPGVARQSLRRPQDPSGTTVPASLNLSDPIQLAGLLPRRAPRFRIDDVMPHAPQWRFVELLGSGGFGEVWLVRHTFLEQCRAVKFCLDPAGRERLLRHEGEIVKRVMSESTRVKPNEHGIVPLVDAYLEGESPWLAYEYVGGGDLAGLIRHLQRADGPRRAEQALVILRLLASIVGRFHRLSQPIVHRDLKPANILLTKDRLLRITDFDISHVAAERGIRQATISTPSLSLGETYRGAHTPIYASPQQKKGLKADVRDDVHALGIIGYQLLLADLSAERPAGKWRKRVADCGLPDAVLDLLESCWDDDPEERPRDALALAEALASTHPTATVPKPLPPGPVPPSQPGRRLHGDKIGDTIEVPLTEALRMKLAWVPPGQSWLGGGGGKPGTQEFTLTKGLWCGVYPVTQAEWQAVMGNNPSSLAGHPRHPVEQVSWDDVQEFLRKLNSRLAASGLAYRLPSTEEWEYICRGGPISQAQSAFHFYFARSKSDLTSAPTNDLSSRQANLDGDYSPGSASKGPNVQATSEVGSYLPNPLGIYDLHGNVWEWTSTPEGSSRLIRGGGWGNRAEDCTVSDWGRGVPDFRDRDLGVRVLAVPSGAKAQTSGWPASDTVESTPADPPKAPLPQHRPTGPTADPVTDHNSLHRGKIGDLIEVPSPPEEPMKDRPTDLFGNAIPTDIFGNEIGSRKRRKKG
jgi:serine/threonine protein kinase